MGKNRKSWPRECCLGGETLKVKNFEPDSWRAVCWSFDACCFARMMIFALTISDQSRIIYGMSSSPPLTEWGWCRARRLTELMRRIYEETKAAEKTQRFLSFSVEKDTNSCRLTWRRKSSNDLHHILSLMRLIRAAVSSFSNKKFNSDSKLPKLLEDHIPSFQCFHVLQLENSWIVNSLPLLY